tara:strand:+ start:1723 stop:2223 length:501 start_codon:yes stop_codon:yes gene_type:complete
MKISRNELKKLIEQELGEYSAVENGGAPHRRVPKDQGGDSDDLGSKGSQKDQVKQFIDDNWVGGGSVAQVRQDLLSAVDALPDLHFKVVKAWGLAEKGDKFGLVDLLLPGGGPPEGVDPRAETAELSGVDAPTVQTRQLYRESKKINKSDLQQVIMQELKAALKES